MFTINSISDYFFYTPTFSKKLPDEVSIEPLLASHQASNDFVQNSSTADADNFVANLPLYFVTHDLRGKNAVINRYNISKITLILSQLFAADKLTLNTALKVYFDRIKNCLEMFEELIPQVQPALDKFINIFSDPQNVKIENVVAASISIYNNTIDDSRISFDERERIYTVIDANIDFTNSAQTARLRVYMLFFAQYFTSSPERFSKFMQINNSRFFGPILRRIVGRLQGGLDTSCLSENIEQRLKMFDLLCEKLNKDPAISLPHEAIVDLKNLLRFLLGEQSKYIRDKMPEDVFYSHMIRLIEIIGLDNFKDPDYGMLYLVVGSGHEKLIVTYIKYCLQNGAFKQFALEYASDTGNFKMISLLLQHAGLNSYNLADCLHILIIKHQTPESWGKDELQVLKAFAQYQDCMNAVLGHINARGVDISNLIYALALEYNKDDTNLFDVWSILAKYPALCTESFSSLIKEKFDTAAGIRRVRSKVCTRNGTTEKTAFDIAVDNKNVNFILLILMRFVCVTNPILKKAPAILFIDNVVLERSITDALKSIAKLDKSLLKPISDYLYRTWSWRSVFERQLYHTIANFNPRELQQNNSDAVIFSPTAQGIVVVDAEVVVDSKLEPELAKLSLQ